jgi:hypothetical protein
MFWFWMDDTLYYFGFGFCGLVVGWMIPCIIMVMSGHGRCWLGGKALWILVDTLY